ncbi:MAG TPA: serine/threonine-protein kinase, partial [Gammaproteobacteria bacterium]
MDTFKQNSYKLAGFIIVLLALMALGTGVLRDLDWKAYGLGLRISPPRAPASQIAIITIDDDSLQALGDWPWSRDLLARMVRLLDKAGAATIGFTLPLDTPQNEISLKTLREFQSGHRNQLDQPTRALFDRLTRQLATDRILAETFRESGNTILSLPYIQAIVKPDNLPDLPVELSSGFIQAASIEGEPPPLYEYVPEAFHPDHTLYIHKLSTATDAIGGSVLSMGPGIGKPVMDGSLSARPLLIPYGQAYLPSFPLLVAANAGNTSQFRAVHGAGVYYGDNLIETDSKFRALPFYYKTKDGLPAFDVYSFHKVLNGDIKPDAFTNKIVMIGLGSSNLVDYLETPLGEKMPPALIEAHTISALLQGDIIATPFWTYWARYLLYLLVAVYLIYLLPKVNFGTGLAITTLLAVIFLNIHFVSMAFASIWLPLTGLTVALVLGHVLLGTKRLIFNRIEHYKSELHKSNKLLGQAYHFQGQLDLAFEKYRMSQPDDELLSLTYNLGLDYERKRQFNKAVNVFRFIRMYKANYRDTRDRIQKNLQTSHTMVLGKSKGETESTLVIAKDGIQKPMLGRYQIEKELGRGAMGTVYLGSDPKIGRTVAIKTMPLSAEFEGDKLEEVKQRFFREAKTAGRLNHYNIVTIYDVGEDQDLAYIAMDYLQGMDMSGFAKKDSLLKVSDVFNVVIQVCDALNYAHEQNVVHRDIKPSNIIYDRRSKKP